MLRLLPEMEFPEEQYYSLNHILLSSIGLWPYDNSNINQIQFVLALLIYITFITVQLMKLFVSECTLDIVLDVLSIDSVIITWSVKYVTFYAIVGNIKEFRNNMRSNWSILRDIREVDIIRKHASLGKLFTIIIATCVYCGTFNYILTQYVPSLLDIIIPLNESRPRELVILAEYFVDQQKYFHILAIHTNIGLLLSATTGIATESFTLTQALHAFGMFKVASYRMERIFSESTPQKCASETIIVHGKIIAAVDAHRRALKYSELIRKNVGIPYLVIVVFIICTTSVNCFNLFRIVMANQGTLELIKSTILIFFHFLFLVLLNYMGQEFTNCDDHVYRTICNTQWYNASLKTQKLILFLLQKTTKTYEIDAGSMFNPSLEGLFAALSLLTSFFMVLCSVKQ